jgi:Mrp family chromosome partitioning ATPase
MRFKTMEIKDTSSAQQLGQLRARIEAIFSERVMIVITSAQSGDGKTATAFGLAASLAQADHRVLLVDANAACPTLPRRHKIASRGDHLDFSKFGSNVTAVAGERFEGVSLADDRFESGTSMEKIRAMALDLRSQFDFVIVDTCQLPKSDLAVLFSTVADATLLTLRLGRLPSAADRETVITLNRVGANLLGVLTVRQNFIRDFNAHRQELAQTIRVPARPFTSRHTLEPEPSRAVVEPSSNVIS